MKKILVLLCSFNMINYIKNTNCEDIRASTERNLRNLNPLTDENCKDGETNDLTKQCFANDERSACITKECKDFGKDDCSTFVPKTSTDICIPDGDNCKIETRTCEQMDPNKCGDLTLSDTTKCTKKTALDECEETARTCTEMASDKCSDYIPTTSTMKCAKRM